MTIIGEKKKRIITEDDVSLILQRYSATTILALLQEIDQFSDVKLDWKSLVKKSSTGITCPREYQMLWRYLAYNHSLAEDLEDAAEPLDDDSDLEIEVEAFPSVSTEASAEAAACVKVLMSSGLPNVPSTNNRPTVEAPLTINIPTGQASDSSDKQQTADSVSGLNITIPVSVNKQPLPSVTSAEGPDGNGPASSRLPAKKKRKLWTREEDMELIAAVQKYGEGNWQNILKEDFKHERTASQLSQRWSILRKNWGKSTSGLTGNNNSSLSEAQLSTRQAISMALNMPMIGGLSAIGSGAMQTSGPVSSPHTSSPSETSTLFAKAPSQSQQSLQQTNSQKGVPSQSKSRPVQTKPLSTIKFSTGPNPLIQKAAFAAGGRIANPSTAASLLKAAQSKNAVHIRHMGAFPISQTPVSKSSPSTVTVAPRPNSAQGRIAPSMNSGMSPSASGPGNQQATCSSSKPLQIASGTSALETPLAPHSPGESKPANSMNDDAHVSNDNMSSMPDPLSTASVPPSEAVGTEQPKVDGCSFQDNESASKTVEINDCAGEVQATLVDLGVADYESDTIEHDNNSTAMCENSGSYEGTLVNVDVGENSNLIVDYVTNAEAEVKPHATAENPDVAEANADDSRNFVGHVVDHQTEVCGGPGCVDGEQLSINEEEDTKRPINRDQTMGRQSDDNQN